MSLRVAMVVPSLRGGGLERMATDLALGLQQRGMTVGVFPVGGLGVYHDELRAAGIEVHDSEERGFRIRGYNRLLIGNLQRFRPDVIHAHSGGWYPAAVARARLRRPVLVFTDHGRYPPEPAGRALIERQLARLTNRIVAVTPSLADYVRQFLRLPQTPAVIANGIDPQRYLPQDGDRQRLRTEWDTSPDAFVFIAVGRLVPIKAHGLIIEALARLDARARLVLVGTGALEHDLRQQAHDLDVASRVRFAGYRADVAACLAAADAWICSSTTEGLPVSLLEAFAAGLPVISTAVGGIPHALGEPPAGILVPSGDGSALAAAMLKLMTDEELRVRLSGLSRARAQHYSLDAMTESYLEVYRHETRSR